MVSLFKIQVLHLNCRPGTSAVFNSQSFSLFLPCFLLPSTVLSNKGKNAKNVCLKKKLSPLMQQCGICLSAPTVPQSPLNGGNIKLSSDLYLRAKATVKNFGGGSRTLPWSWQPSRRHTQRQVMMTATLFYTVITRTVL